MSDASCRGWVMTATNMGTGYGIGCYAPSPVGEVRALLVVSVVRGLQGSDKTGLGYGCSAK